MKFMPKCHRISSPIYELGCTVQGSRAMLEHKGGDSIHGSPAINPQQEPSG